MSDWSLLTQPCAKLAAETPENNINVVQISQQKHQNDVSWRRSGALYQ